MKKAIVKRIAPQVKARPAPPPRGALTPAEEEFAVLLSDAVSDDDGWEDVEIGRETVKRVLRAFKYLTGGTMTKKVPGTRGVLFEDSLDTGPCNALHIAIQVNRALRSHLILDLPPDEQEKVRVLLEADEGRLVVAAYGSVSLRERLEAEEARRKNLKQYAELYKEFEGKDPRQLQGIPAPTTKKGKKT